MLCCDQCKTHNYTRRFMLQPNVMKQLQLFHINMNTNTRLHSTSLTSGPVYAGCGGATGSADGRMLASASNGSTSGACAWSTTQHMKTSNMSFKANSDFSSYLFGFFSCCARNFHLYLQHISRISAQHDPQRHYNIINLSLQYVCCHKRYRAK